MKNLKTIAIILVVAGLGVLAWKLATRETGPQMADEALSEFAVKDTAAVEKLILTDTQGSEGVTLFRKDGHWEMEGKRCVQQHLVETILETIKYIRVKSPVPKGAIETINKNIVAHHIKMEI